MQDSDEVKELKSEIFSLHNEMANLRNQVKDSEDELIEWIQRHADVVEQKNDEIADGVDRLVKYERKFVGSLLSRIKNAVLLVLGKI